MLTISSKKITDMCVDFDAVKLLLTKKLKADANQTNA